MVVGFNHNFTYKGVVYHIQTEDSGRKSPTIVTLLYCGGTILASRKTSYADIALVDNLEQVVEALMKDQHKAMLRSLKNGEFDDAIDRYARVATAIPPMAATDASPPVSTPAAPRSTESSPPVAPAPQRSVATPAAAIPLRSASPPAEALPLAPPAPLVKKNPGETSLDEIILSYLIGEDK